VAGAQGGYRLGYTFSDTTIQADQMGLQTVFTNRILCNEYIFELPKLLQKKGFPAASVDSIRMDSALARIVIFLGPPIRWASLNTSSIPDDILAAAGYKEKTFLNQPLNYATILSLQQGLLDKLENNGYPFAQLSLDSIEIGREGLQATLKLVKGPLYKIDSIRVFGNANISNQFLQRYLEIPNGSLYQKQKLQQISQRLLQLPYLVEEQKWNMNLLGTGSILNLYLKNKKTSQINGLLGFLPTTDQAGNNKLVVTGDFNLNLKNGFGLGESLQILFQQIQVQSPRLQLSYQQPYLFGSAFGADFSFDGFKKDSSFLNIRIQAGVQYSFGGNRNGKVFFQQFLTTLDFVDTTSIRQSRLLPEQIDQSTANMGVDYEWWNTDYRFNPRTGYELKITGSAGIRRIKPNNAIVSLKNPVDPSFDYSTLYDSIQLRAYTFRLKANAARFFKTGKQTTLKTAVNLGWVQSPRLFRNELFQLGGFQLLRGFDDESIFASAYAVLTLEYRILIGLNSFLYTFADGGTVTNNSQFSNTTNQFVGAGLGMAFETKAGIFNLALAAGKRSDNPLNLRQTKIHFGYLNFF
jgi:outer membrane protein assembly factor BamA